METMGVPVELIEKIAEAMEGADMDDVISALACLLAKAGSMTCDDKDLFAGYVMSVIDHEFDNEGETLQ